MKYIKGFARHQIALIPNSLEDLVDEYNEVRIGLEYNFILKADIKVPNRSVIGTVDNSYLGFSIGFMLGGST